MIFKKTNLNYSSLITYICLAGIILLQNNYRHNIKNQNKVANYFQEEKELNSKINLQKILPAFGFDNLKADTIFLNFIQYFGDGKARDATGYSLTPEYFETLINHDANFVSAHLSLANANTMYAGQPEASISFIEDIFNSASLNNNSQKHALLWLYKAYDELLFLGDTQAAEYSYKQAKKLLENNQTNSAGNIVSVYFPNTASFKGDSDIIQAQITAWSTVLPNVKNLENRQKITQKITDLKTLLNQVQLTEKSLSSNS